MNINVERIDRSGATQGVWGIRSPVPHRGLSRSDWGVKKSARSAERRKGSGEYGPQCPTGAVPKGLGVEGILYGKMNFAI